jgi:H+-translocating NAD(P) transhydrogenase subunit beta
VNTPASRGKSKSRYAGVQNPLFFRENSAMLFGDAKERVEDILRALDSHRGEQGRLLAAVGHRA